MKDLINKIHLGDCVDFMRQMPDKSVDLVLTDPPYGIGEKRLSDGRGKLKNRIIQTANTAWDIAPTKEIFDEIFRISKNQIIFGGNYFALPRCRCFIAWDKQQPWDNFSQVEYAWTSFDNPARLYCINKSDDKDKIHPTQKPLRLFKKCLIDFTKEKDLIFDPFSGSGTTAIASADLGRKFICVEKDPEYYAASVKRLDEFQAQGVLNFSTERSAR